MAVGRLISGSFLILTTGAVLLAVFVGVDWWTDRSPAATAEVMDLAETAGSSDALVAVGSTTTARGLPGPLIGGIAQTGPFKTTSVPAGQPPSLPLPTTTTTTASGTGPSTSTTSAGTTPTSITATTTTSPQPPTTLPPTTTATTSPTTTTSTTPPTTVADTTTIPDATTTTCAGNSEGNGGGNNCH